MVGGELEELVAHIVTGAERTGPLEKGTGQAPGLEAAQRLGAQAGERGTEFGNRAAAEEEPSRGWSGKADGADAGRERQGGGEGASAGGRASAGSSAG